VYRGGEGYVGVAREGGLTVIVTGCGGQVDAKLACICLQWIGTVRCWRGIMVNAIQFAPMMDSVMQTDFPMEVIFRLVSEGTAHSDIMQVAVTGPCLSATHKPQTTVCMACGYTLPACPMPVEITGMTV